MSFLDCIGDLNNIHENQHLEFKEASFSLPKDMWETYSAFANTEGGDIVLGVREDKESHRFYLDGVSDAESVITDFWSTLRNRQKVSRDVMLADGVKLEQINDVDFVVVNVPRAARGEKPVQVYDKSEKRLIAFVRRGAGDFKASESDLARMHYDCIPSADRSPLDCFGMGCLNEGTIARYRSVFSGIKPRSPWNGDSVEDFLYHIGAAAKGRDGRLHPTQAGLLAFGHEYEITNYLPRYLLDYREETSGDLRWDDRIVSQSGDWSGNLVDFYLAVADRIRRYFKIPYSTDETGTIHGSRNAVTEAANEAIVNALVHAYYGEESEVRIILKEDALEVTNSGSMLMDKEVAIAGGVSEMRNPTLMRIFSFIGASDRAGSGLFDIWSTWHGEFGREPSLEELHGPASVRITMPLVNTRSFVSGMDAEKTQRTVSNDVLIGALAASSEGMTAKEAQLSLGVSERTAQERFKALVDEGVLVRVKEGRSFRYFVKE